MNNQLYAKDLFLTDEGGEKSTRDGVGEGLIELGKTNDDVMVLCADLPDSTRTKEFLEMFPERYIECGVAEQNMAGIAAGLALSGKIPYMASFGVFSPGRNWDQIRVSICYSKANVKIISSHTGLGVGEDGASHQALEDIAIMRVIPNMAVIAPSDAIEAKKAIIASASYAGPVYIRYGRQNVTTFSTDKTPFAIGKGYRYIEGKDVTICTTGTMCAEAMTASERLRDEGVFAEVLNFPTIKPMDHELLSESVRKTGCVVTVEDHQIAGGFGSAICESLVAHYVMAPVARIGMQDSFGQSAPYKELYSFYGLDAEHIVKAAFDVLNVKHGHGS